MISRSVVEKWAKNSENHEIWANFEPLQICLGTPKILKPVLDTPFQDLLLGKVWTTPTLGHNIGSLGLPNFNGDRPPNFGPNF